MDTPWCLIEGSCIELRPFLPAKLTITSSAIGWGVLQYRASWTIPLASSDVPTHQGIQVSCKLCHCHLDNCKRHQTVVGNNIAGPGDCWSQACERRKVINRQVDTAKSLTCQLCKFFISFDQLKFTAFLFIAKNSGGNSLPNPVDSYPRSFNYTCTCTLGDVF